MHGRILEPGPNPPGLGGVVDLYFQFTKSALNVDTEGLIFAEYDAHFLFPGDFQIECWYIPLFV